MSDQLQHFLLVPFGMSQLDGKQYKSTFWNNIPNIPQNQNDGFHIQACAEDSNVPPRWPWLLFEAAFSLC